MFFEDSLLPVLSDLFYYPVGQRVNIVILPVEFHKIHLWTHQVPSHTTCFYIKTPTTENRDHTLLSQHTRLICTLHERKYVNPEI